MRREFPVKVKKAAFARCCKDGIPHCEECGIALTPGNVFYDHDKADGLGGEPTLENCKVLCKTCHDKKTFGHDNPIMQKADRNKKSAYRVKNRKGKPILGSKASGWKRKMSGEWIRREK